MRRLALPLLAVLALGGSATANAPPTVKPTAAPVTTVAMDGSRVAYASGGKVYVCNVANGAASLVRGRYAKSAAELAIAGKRLAWIARFDFGLTHETDDYLYAASLARPGVVTRLALAHRTDGYEGPISHQVWDGDWIAGLVGSGKVLAVSRWRSYRDGSSTNERLSAVAPTRLTPIVGAKGTAIAQSLDFGRIAVLRSSDAWPDNAAAPPTPAPNVGLYSATSGKLLAQVLVPGAEELALAGPRLVVLTAAKTIGVYDWATGDLVHSWPVVVSTPKLASGHLTAYGKIAAYSVDPHYATPRALHVLNLVSGKDVVLATARGTGLYQRDAALGSRGLVYVANSASRGKLVFVPTAKLLQAVS